MSTATQPLRHAVRNTAHNTAQTGITLPTLTMLQRALATLSAMLHDEAGARRDAFLAESTSHEDHDRRLRALREHEARRAALFRTL